MQLHQVCVNLESFECLVSEAHLLAGREEYKDLLLLVSLQETK